MKIHRIVIWCDTVEHYFMVWWRLQSFSSYIKTYYSQLSDRAVGVNNCSACWSSRALKWIGIWSDISCSFTYICYEGNQPTIFVWKKLLPHAFGNDYMKCQLTWLPEHRINRGDPSGFPIEWFCNELIYYLTWGQWNILSDFKWHFLTKRGVKHHLYVLTSLTFQNDMPTFRQRTRSHLSPAVMSQSLNIWWTSLIFSCKAMSTSEDCAKIKVRD